MTLDPYRAGFEEVFTVTDYYDGPRQGIANYGGSPHFYDCVISDEKQNYSDLYRLTPVTDQAFQLALEDWAIWERWDRAFKAGQTSEKTHPALPEDAARHAEIKSLVADYLKTDDDEHHPFSQVPHPAASGISRWSRCRLASQMVGTIRRIQRSNLGGLGLRGRVVGIPDISTRNFRIAGNTPIAACAINE